MTSAPLAPLSSLRADLPTAVSDVLVRALARDVDRRWGSVREFARALEVGMRMPPRRVIPEAFATTTMQSASSVAVARPTLALRGVGTRALAAIVLSCALAVGLAAAFGLAGQDSVCGASVDCQ